MAGGKRLCRRPGRERPFGVQDVAGGAGRPARRDREGVVSAPGRLLVIAVGPIDRSFGSPTHRPRSSDRTTLDLDPRTGTLAYRRARRRGPFPDAACPTDRPHSEGARIGGCAARAATCWRSRSPAAVRGRSLVRLDGACRRDRVVTLASGRAGSAAASPFRATARRFARRVGNASGRGAATCPAIGRPSWSHGQETLWIHFASLGRSCLLVREFDQSGPRRPQSHVLIRWDGETARGGARRSRPGLPADSGASSPSRGRSAAGDVASIRPRRGSSRSSSTASCGSCSTSINHLAVLGRDGRLIAMFYVVRPGVRGLDAGRDVPGFEPADRRRAVEGRRRADRRGAAGGRARGRGDAMTVQVPFQLRRRDVGGPAAGVRPVRPRPRRGRAAGASARGWGSTRRAASTTSPGASCSSSSGRRRSRSRAPPDSASWRPTCSSPSTPSWSPSLLDDEAAGLVRDGGLVFLPGGPVLRFDREATLGPRGAPDRRAAPSPRAGGPCPSPAGSPSGSSRSRGNGPSRRRRTSTASGSRTSAAPEVATGIAPAGRARPGRSRPAARTSARPEGAGDRLRPAARRPGHQGLGDTLRDLIGRAGAGPGRSARRSSGG